MRRFNCVESTGVRAIFTFAFTVRVAFLFYCCFLHEGLVFNPAEACDFTLENCVVDFHVGKALIQLVKLKREARKKNYNFPSSPSSLVRSIKGFSSFFYASFLFYEHKKNYLY